MLPSTVAGETVHELVIKKSRFLARAVHVASVDEADAVIARVRKEFWDARHSCTALVVGPHADQQRSNDDGEPSGTAGVPMLEVLRQRDLTDVVVVVTRYFGGVLLGAGGLVRAYSSSVSEVLDRAPLVRRALMDETTIEVPHAEAGRLEHFLREWTTARGAVLDDVTYGGTGVTFALLVPPRRREVLAADLAATSAGAVEATVVGQRVTNLPG
ncbi:hypothetical protein GCM10011331_11810 [Flavimobilis marinus]|uniref:Uncharacterized protein, YigZ family n=1 Tax=Flavimobilis marinus TaxID=285351 RepID=A0A1I2HUT2_9MICO|nr:YigZ family protein [Flavimobilis marinus]GHG49329.1 hypothetical protein GCM10011331_11810 [Flavimobilis marinus]SFF33925.1 uncharacterized protein, YigZ family [Flavimobilis marinus]